MSAARPLPMPPASRHMPAGTATTIRRYVDAGAERIYLQILDLSDLDHVDFIAQEVAPLLA